MASVLMLLFWLTIMTASASRCNEKGCDAHKLDSNEYLDVKINEHSSPVNSRMIERSASYSTVSRSPQGVRISSKLEQVNRKEDGTLKKTVDDRIFFPDISTRQGQSDDRIIFPDHTENMESLVPVIPEECKKLGYCENIPNYPQAHVNELVSSLKDPGSKFHIDELDISDTPDIAQRIGKPEEDIDLCASKEKLIKPEAAPDKDGVWHVVINNKDHPLQGFRAEICNVEESPCADFVSFQPGYRARCIQKRLSRAMQTLDKTGVMVERQLEVPSCCSCVAQFMPIN